MASEASTIDAATYPRGFSRDIEWRWPLVPARKLVTLNYGRALKADSRSPGKIPVFGTNGQCGWHDAPLAKAPGLVLGRKGQGPLGVEWCDNDFWVIDTAYYASTLTPDLDLKYLYHLVKYVGLNHLKDGTSNPTLSRDTFGAQLFPFPPLAEQKAIAAVLGALDDKIELNRRMNATLEAMARALFQSWFVDFDPVRAKLDGRQPVSLDPATAALFPDSFQDSSLGQIPKGWTVCPLSNLTQYLSRGIGPSYLEHGGVCVLNQKCVRDHRVDFSKSRRHDAVKKPINDRALQLHDVLVNSTGMGTLGRMAQVFRLPEVAIVDSHITIVRAASEIDPLFLGINLAGREAEIEELGEGSTGQTELSRARLGALKIITPPLELQRAFGAAVGPLLMRISENEGQSRTLATLRDTLLPKLLSGELSVASAIDRMASCP